MSTVSDHPRAPSCLACGSDKSEPWAEAWDAEYLTSEERFVYHRCATCGVLFIDPCPSDRLAEIYPANYYAYVTQEQSFAHRIKDWIDAWSYRGILRALHGSSLAVLDVGGGDGAIPTLLRQLDARVERTWVVDMDPQAEVRARAAGHEYFCGRIEDFRTDERFDLVVLLNLIEHVPNPASVLSDVRHSLAPGGRVLVKTPNHASLDARIFRHRNWSGYHCPRHFVLFDRPSFRALAERAGLCVESLRFTQGAAFWSISVLFWLAQRGWVQITRERPAMMHPLFGLLAAPFAAFDLIRGLVGGHPSQMFVVLKAGSDAGET